MNILFRALVVLCALFLSACSGIDPNVREYDAVQTLAANEGYIILGSLSSNPSVKFEFSSGFGTYLTESFVAGVDHHMLVLPEGDYHLSAVYANTAQFLPKNASRFHDWSFHVQAGKINYFGEMVFEGNSFRKHYGLAAITKFVQEKYPKLYQQYGIVEAAR